jgi:hypothetical protein
MNRSTISLCVLHLTGNALLLLLGYYWLGLGESDNWRLAISAGVILLFCLAALWLHGTALVLFRDGQGLTSAATRTLRHLLPLFLFSWFVLLVYVGLQHLDESFGHQAFVIGSYTTMKLRRPVAPNNVLKTFHLFIWLVRWVGVPVLALPLAAAIASNGWTGLNRSALRRSRKLLFWIEAGVLTSAAVYLPLHLFFWVPKMPSFSLEVASVMARVGFGYLLFTAGWLAVEFFTSSGKPRDTQASTAVSP